MTDSSGEDSSGEEHPVVSKEWLEAVLGRYFNETISVESYTLRPGCDDTDTQGVMNDVVVLSDIASLHVEFQRGSEATELYLILKLLPPNPFSRYFVSEAQFDLREIMFYTQMAPQLRSFEEANRTEDNAIELPIPVCFYAKHVPVDGSEVPTSPTLVDESVILLQDLKHENFKCVNFIQGLTVEQTESALDSIARVHALSLGIKLKEKKNLNERYDFLFQIERASDSFQQLVEKGLPALSRFLEKRGDMGNILDRLAALKSSTKDLIAALLTPDEPLALITHTDFWSNNLLFRGNECIILDWQMITCSRPTNDVALLIISSTQTELRREHTSHFLDVYWQHFSTYCSRVGVALEDDLCYSRARLAEDYRRSQLLALLLCIGSVDLAIGNPRTEQRIIDVLIDLNKDGILSPDIVPTAQVSV